MKNIKVKHVPLIAVSLFLIKALALGSTWQDVGVLGIISALAFLYEFKVRDEQLIALESKLTAMSTEIGIRLAEQDRVIAENRSYITNKKLEAASQGSKRDFRF